MWTTMKNLWVLRGGREPVCAYGARIPTNGCTRLSLGNLARILAQVWHRDRRRVEVHPALAASPESPAKGDLSTRVAYQRGRDLSQNGYG